MKASCANLAAAGLVLAAGSAAFGATGAAAGLRAAASAPPVVSVWRGGDHGAIEERRRRAGSDHRNGLDWFGVVGPIEGETPAGQEEETPQAAALCPPFAAPGRVAAASFGPRIIDVGKRTPAARRGPLPVVVYGDSLR